MNRYPILSLLLAAAALFATRAAADENLILNADLADLRNNLPHNWAFRARPEVVAIGDVVEDPERGRVLHIHYERGADRAYWSYQPPERKPPFIAGVKYRLTAWMKCELKNRPQPRYGPHLYLCMHNDSAQLLREIHLTPMGNIRHGELLRLDQLPASVPWTKLEVVFTAPDSAASWALYWTTSGVAGDVWVGGFSLTPAPPNAKEGPFVD